MDLQKKSRLADALLAARRRRLDARLDALLSPANQSPRQETVFELLRLAHRFPQPSPGWKILLKAAQEMLLLGERRGRGRPRKTLDWCTEVAAVLHLVTGANVTVAARRVEEIMRPRGATKNRVAHRATLAREYLKSLSPREREIITARAQKRLSTGVK